LRDERRGARRKMARRAALLAVLALGVAPALAQTCSVPGSVYDAAAARCVCAVETRTLASGCAAGAPAFNLAFPAPLPPGVAILSPHAIRMPVGAVVPLIVSLNLSTPLAAMEGVAFSLDVADPRVSAPPNYATLVGGDTTCSVRAVSAANGSVSTSTAACVGIFSLVASPLDPQALSPSATLTLAVTWRPIPGFSPA
jgi:hypothetical protein